jgi:hypothetical protein
MLSETENIQLIFDTILVFTKKNQHTKKEVES